jgi:CheY-like chemotaxis protein
VPIVLIVEDDPAVRANLGELARDCGYRVANAANGAAALEQLELLSRQMDVPTLILLDLMMPTMDGRQFLAICQTRADFRSIPVVVLTADDRGAVNVRDQPGVVAVLTKPFALADFEAVLETLASPPSGIISLGDQP